MNPHRMLGLALVVFVLAGCSNKSAQLTGPSAPSTESSQYEPGPPVEKASPPRIHAWTDDGWREFQRVGAYSLDPENIFDLEITEQQQPVTFHWSSHPAGLTVGFRWCVDPEDLSDESPRKDETDLGHWSTWSPTETSATVPPFTPGLHWFYIQARTVVGYISIFPIRIQVVSESDPAISQAR
jgi:hypothetical protein